MSEMYESILDRIISNISGATDMITKFYQQAGKHMLTVASVGSPPLQPHWWNSYYDVLKHQKYQAIRLFRATNTPLDLRFYKDKRNAFKSYCNHQVLNNQIENRTSLLKSRNDSTSFWNFFNEVNHVKPLMSLYLHVSGISILQISCLIIMYNY